MPTPEEMEMITPVSVSEADKQTIEILRGKIEKLAARLKEEQEAPLRAELARLKEEHGREVEELCDKLKKVASDNEALERHFRELNGETDAIKAIQLLCRSGRMDYDRAETAEREIAALKAERDELIAAYDAYLRFLSESDEAPISMAYVHGWRCPQKDIDKGIEHREKLKKLTGK